MAFLFDLDGVFYQANRVIDGAVEVSDWVKSNKIPYLFLTNTSSRPRSELVKKLQAFGIDTNESHLFTPAVAALQWIEKNIANKKIALFVADKTRTEFSACKIWQEGDAVDDIGAVVIGDLGYDWSFEKLNQAFRLLMQESRPRLIALGMTRYWQANDGLQLDVAPFVVALSHAANTEPLVMGKPAQSFYAAAVERAGSEQKTVYMLGDDIHADIDGAQKAGLKAILVRTGKFRPSDLELGIVPEAVLDSIRDLPGWWQESMHE